MIKQLILVPRRQEVNRFLIAAGVATFLAAIAHVVCIFVGATGYRFMGAGEQLAQLAEQGHWYPIIVTLVISLVLLLWSWYALSGAGLGIKLPLLRIGLTVIAFIFLVRAASFPWLMAWIPDNSQTFWWISSSVCLLIGVCYAIGLVQNWSHFK